ncbi:MAG: hypothetical protein A2754_02560 [Candidatus Magasanikbacteria bacterium RIFCSPHIGHO2_01_FULL_47_8]|uniref:Prepilin-type N-terminal cleavage/methylation domain-containing protein n=1 Tax=Candidatus Magasanikbacteria bacterium RIFCSPHIGHO2_01_FULL_47_8 TaxID=1798673 RepID=A0A1F6MBZ3_9BACT|nr:MAG: hypothetical protein A2754_02560 [Candidatus Magasanikbacteria bacterium RIFCSPHIGHO2_01_FULL_47_8]
MTRPNGFSILEVIVGVGIFAVLLLALFGLYEGYGKLYSVGQAEITTLTSARKTLNEIGDFTAQAHRILASQVINSTTYQSSSTTLVLQLPAITGTGDVVANSWDYVVFYSGGTTTLYRYLQVDAASSRGSAGLKSLSTIVSNITFTYDNADFTQVKKAGVALSVQARDNHQLITKYLTEQIGLKNY